MQAIASHQAPVSTLAIPPTMAAPPPRYVTIRQGTEYLPFTEAALRDIKFKAFDRKNSRGEIIAGNGSGPAGVWVQVGNKVLIDLEAGYRWIESQKVSA